MKIDLKFEKYSRYERKSAVFTAAIPFARSELTEIGRCGLSDARGSCPAQFRALSFWEDGSVKWLLVTGQTDLPGQSGWSVGFSDEGGAAVPDGIRVEGSHVDTGRLALTLGKPGEKPLSSLTLDGIEYGAAVGKPELKDENGAVYYAGVGENGWETIESGPVRAIFRTRGGHINDMGGRFFSYELTLTVCRDSQYVDIDYRVINDMDEESRTASSSKLVVSPEKPVGEAECFCARSNTFVRYIEPGEDGRASFDIDANFLKYEGNEQNPEVIYGTFFAGWRDERRGLSVTVYQAQQNFPKSLESSPDGVSASLIPERSDGISFVRGMAKTHRLRLLLYLPGELDRAALTERSIAYQLPDKPFVPREVYERSGAFEDIFVKEPYIPAELWIYDAFNVRAYSYGMLHWGDTPDSDYTTQGRGKGKPVFVNGEYDTAHAFFLRYVTSADRAAYGAFKASAEHTLDVDISHYDTDPMIMGCQKIHSANHCTAGCELSHEWVEGLLDYWHETGDPEVLGQALGVGENVARLLERFVFSKKADDDYVFARDVGWSLRLLCALYSETGDRKWLDLSRRISEYFISWEKALGSFLTPVTSNTLARIPFMEAVALNALMRYYAITGEPEVRRVMLSVTDDLAENCYLKPYDLPYYKELPSLRIILSTGLELASLAYAYRLSGDKKYLEKGMNTFKYFIGQKAPDAPDDKPVIDSSLMLSSSGKTSSRRFSMSYPPFLIYYAAVKEAGLL